jgi:hypothetical protein
MAANNQGIAHLRIGGMTGRFANIACKNRNAHMAVSFADFPAEPRQCARCAAWVRKYEERKTKRSVCT